MARIVLGNREGLLAIRHGRNVLELLTEEWPDLHLTLRTQAGTGGLDSDPLLEALRRGAVGIAAVQLDALAPTLPEDVRLAAVLRRADPRSGLAAKGRAGFAALPPRARVVVGSQRDAAFLSASHPDLTVQIEAASPDALLAQLSAGADAVIVSAAAAATLDLRSAVDVVLDETAFTPPPGQGALGLLVRADDDLAFETAYSLQHRPSYDRVRAERAFAAALPGRQVGAGAGVTEDGELTLLGAVAVGPTILQASLSGEAREAEVLARELAHDVAEQLAALT